MRSLRTTRVTPRVFDDRVRPGRLGGGSCGYKARVQRGYLEVRSEAVWRVVDACEQWRALAKERARELVQLELDAMAALDD